MGSYPRNGVDGDTPPRYADTSPRHATPTRRYLCRHAPRQHPPRSPAAHAPVSAAPPCSLTWNEILRECEDRMNIVFDSIEEVLDEIRQGRWSL